MERIKHSNLTIGLDVNKCLEENMFKQNYAEPARSVLASWLFTCLIFCCKNTKNENIENWLRFIINYHSKGSRKKVPFLVVGPLKGGGGGGMVGTVRKETFFKTRKKNPIKRMTTKLEAGGGRALVVEALKKMLFFAASLTIHF